jgi:hypothetical protein
MKLKIICGWCRKDMGTKTCKHFDEDLPRITHSICEKCRAKVLDDLKQTDESQRAHESPLTIERR